MLTTKSISKLNKLVMLQLKAMAGNLYINDARTDMVLVWLDLGVGFQIANSEYIYCPGQPKEQTIEDIQKYVSGCGTAIHLQAETK